MLSSAGRKSASRLGHVSTSDNFYLLVCPSVSVYSLGHDFCGVIDWFPIVGSDQEQGESEQPLERSLPSLQAVAIVMQL